MENCSVIVISLGNVVWMNAVAVVASSVVVSPGNDVHVGVDDVEVLGVGVVF